MNWRARIKSMVISVVVPTFNRREVVKRTVESLFAQDFPSADYEIIVVVDGSRDGTADALRALKAPCRFQIVEQANKGLAGARNSGAQAAGAELLLFLDDATNSRFQADAPPAGDKVARQFAIRGGDRWV